MAVQAKVCKRCGKPILPGTWSGAQNLLCSCPKRQKVIPGLGRLTAHIVLTGDEDEAGSDLERHLATQLKALQVPPPLCEYRFDRTRAWRLDFAWPALSSPVAVEVEGGIWTQGRHNRPTGYLRDLQKYNALSLAGWTLLRYAEDRVRDGSAAQEIKRVIEGRMA